MNLAQGIARASVIIPVRDDVRVFECLASVRRAAANVPQVPVEIVVVDNDSTQELAEMLATAEATVLREPVVGAFKARNRGIEHATGDVVFFTDAACEVHADWLQQGIEAMESSAAEIAQGFSGSLGGSFTDQLIQECYQSRFRGIPDGAAVECDTRNMVVRRHVFEQLRFNDERQRVSDTEFGLTAEQRGFRVSYQPRMRVDHHHDASLRIYLSKQMVHGWGAQRLVTETPSLRWHSGHARAVSRLVRTFGRLPLHRTVINAFARCALLGGSLLERRGPVRKPAAADRMAFVLLDKIAILLGHAMYETGWSEEDVLVIMRRQIASASGKGSN